MFKTKIDIGGPKKNRCLIPPETLNNRAFVIAVTSDRGSAR
jgi:hypothetical protein